MVISSEPLRPDPWEAEMVEVRGSGLEQAGEGLFALQDLPSHSLVSLYAGVRLSSVRARQHGSDYRIRLTADKDLDIPDSCRGLDRYRATLAHKANHSFSPNTVWDLMEHPRFGLIRALCSTQDIPAGQEITVNYNLGLAAGPDWYRLLWLRHVRETKHWTEEAVQRYIERNYDMTMKRIVLPSEDTLVVPEPVGARGEQEEEEREEQ